jgi:hypothetical protein
MFLVYSVSEKIDHYVKIIFVFNLSQTKFKDKVVVTGAVTDRQTRETDGWTSQTIHVWQTDKVFKICFDSEFVIWPLKRYFHWDF